MDLKVINVGLVNVFLINSCVLVDTGVKNNDIKIINAIKQFGINPKDIKLIILTHGHSDHMGGYRELVKETNAELLIHDIEYKQIKGQILDEIKPTTVIGKLVSKKSEKQNSTIDIDKDFSADIIIEDDFDLITYGVNGKVIHTPGHTKGSVSVLLDNGDAIIGDNLMAFISFLKPKKPFIAYDVKKVKSSILKLIDKGATTFYLSHGKSYDISIIKTVIDSM